MKSVMAHQFARIPKADIPRSSFDRSHGYKTTFNSGELIPFYIDEALPGDTFNCNVNLLARLATPIVPIMDNIFLDTQFFAVPIRLVWDNWQKFNGEQANPGDSTDYLIPTITPPTNGFPNGSIHDYMGLPTNVKNLTGISTLWHRAYNLCWNEWYRSQDLQESVPVPKGDGPDPADTYKLLRRGKRHDYFTSALPWPQKGPGVELPIGGSVPVYGTGKALGLTDGTTNYSLSSFTDQSTSLLSKSNVGAAIGTAYAASNPSASKVLGIVSSGESGLYADLSETSAATINSLRQAMQLQKMYERDARGGSRYCEIIRSHFGVFDPMSAILQRPEFLGGSTTRVNINTVPQMSSSDNTSPQGNLAAFGLAADRHHGFTKSFTEHTLIIGLLSVRADLTYQQGLPRKFSRSTRYDFYWPALAHLGEQAVLNKEIYAQGTEQDNNVFGYQERWSEYRYFPSTITGKFRSTDPQSLDCWHLSQEFENLPVLNAEFIEEHPPIERVIAVKDEPEFILDSYIDLKCARPMPIYSVPGLTDHF